MSDTQLAAHLAACQQRFNHDPGDRNRAALADAFVQNAAHEIRALWPAAHQVVVRLGRPGRYGPHPTFDELRSPSTSLVARGHLPFLWPDDAELFALALHSVYAAIELTGRTGAAGSWQTRFASAAAAADEPLFRDLPWRITTAGPGADCLAVILPPRRSAAPTTGGGA
ncbi:hypothetical protein [Streptomyces sp. NRRL B-24484]|uniref:hypothetical protein n=1 Tax=Streptomyces sp. NRRL B-24484 TaxID=1463833 RepID=UPI0004C12286|nr:hypothetical protein [Streptomyces sp. NRRL B-24484]